MRIRDDLDRKKRLFVRQRHGTGPARFSKGLCTEHCALLSSCRHHRSSSQNDTLVDLPKSFLATSSDLSNKEAECTRIRPRIVQKRGSEVKESANSRHARRAMSRAWWAGHE
ncbi:uncharacterized protein K489DRAFT_97893 [Dissoconium aciculare CBS 342.82]|uniref:Uncharacterized protein n=1 Tax=Dissoconium aciculare CBS 342.82 TaxID=1314786 RepID=A0A6J3MD08_9PEZI|nr:uncharacterized protein K489DRAFT_97893 [Dissoconium aciculare CBS 342.82]KAF1825763.1 hypothetical protein K489DRAFT_97893 [Dissoconium aciculare CBS 342.82]